MNPLPKYLVLSVLASALAACSSGDDATSPDTGDLSGLPLEPSPVEPPDGDLNPGTPGSPVQPEPEPLPPGTPSGIDTVTGPILPVVADDLYFTALDYDPETAIAGGAPTTPKNLRIDLVSNDWAEFSWAPSSDDGAVVEYRVRRLEDGHVYSVRGDQTDPSSGTVKELERYWKTTSFIDCNYTRFAERIHDCGTNGPKPGDVYTYEVTAVDDEGNESAPSNQITIRYHDLVGSAVSTVADLYGPDADEYQQNTDLSDTAYFLDDFQLAFEEEFDEGRIDERVWNTELIWGDGTIINGEQQYFVPLDRVAALGHDPFVFSEPGATPSTLTLSAIPTPASVRERARAENLLPENCLRIDPDRGTETCAFLSGALSSHDKYNFLYGYVEGRMKVSGASGALSSFYLYHRYPGEGKNFHAPEIDILEYLGENPFVDNGGEDAFQNYHFGDASLYVRTGEKVTRTSPTMSHTAAEGNAYYPGDFHTYGVLWEPQLIIWYIDGKEVRRLTGPQVSRIPMNIVTYLVTGSGWAPTPNVNDQDLFPIEYEIDWIRTYQRGGYFHNGVEPEQG